MQSLTSQFYAFSVTILIGSVIGMFYDTHRVLLQLVRPSKLIQNLGDLLFWLVASVVWFYLLLIGNWGEMRFYVFVGVILGFAVYFRFLSTLYTKIVHLVVLTIQKVIHILLVFFAFIWRVITYPFILIHKIIIVPIGFLGSLLHKLKKYIGNKMNSFFIAPIYRKVRKIKESIKSVFKKKK